MTPSFQNIIIRKSKIEIWVVTLIVVLNLFWTVIPFIKFPFFFLLFASLIYLLVSNWKSILSNITDFAKNYFLVLLLLCIIIISFLFSNKLYLIIFKDTVNVIILLFLFFLLTIIVSSKIHFDFFVHVLFIYFLLFAFIISVYGLLNSLNIISDKNSVSELSIAGNVLRDSSPIDYNFALLPVFFGMIVTFYYFCRGTSSNLFIGLLNFFLIILSLNIFFSGSRRGFILLVLSILLLLGSQISLLFKRDNIFKKLGTGSVYYLLSVFILSATCYLSVSFTSYSFKNKIIESLGSKNILMTKTKITLSMLRYLSVFDESINYTKLFQRIWTPGFNSSDPESSWGSRIHKTIFPLTGENVDIVPHGARGYLIDNSCFVPPYPQTDDIDLNTLIENLKVKKEEKYKASICCFVSNDFDGRSVRFQVGWKAILLDKSVTDYTLASYDINNKGHWQKLEIDFICSDGEVPIYAIIDNKEGGNFSDLRGYVIFAYPRIDLEKTKDTIAILPDTNRTRDLSQKDSFTLSENTTDYYRTSLFSYKLPILNALLLNRKQLNLQKRGINFFYEDTTYYGYKKLLNVDTISYDSEGSRIRRWQFALQIFEKEYTWKQKIFGSGFDHLNWFGYYFLNDKTKSDWPHNPFLSILLYSGIIGLLVYIFFLYKVFYYYIKYIKEYPLLFIFFLVTFFFSFFSGGSPFDPPVMGFLVILPFFIHYIHKKEATSRSQPGK